MPMLGGKCVGCEIQLTASVGDYADLYEEAGSENFPLLDICIHREKIEAWSVGDNPAREHSRWFCRQCWRLLLPAVLED